MSIAEIFELFALIGGIFGGASFGLLVAWVKDAELRRAQAEMDNERAELAEKEDDLSTQMVDCFFEREKVEELRGHVLYKSNLLDEKLKSVSESEESLSAREKDVSQREEAWEEKKAQYEAKLAEMEEQLKGARARARRLSSKN